MAREPMYNFYRQGDIMLQRVVRTPKGVPKKNNVVAEGEATGHRHWFDAPKAVVFEDKLGNEYVELIEDTVLVHSGPEGEPVWDREEAQKKDLHIALNVKAGKYIVLRERDQDAFTDRTRMVID